MERDPQHCARRGRECEAPFPVSDPEGVRRVLIAEAGRVQQTRMCPPTASRSAMGSFTARDHAAARASSHRARRRLLASVKFQNPRNLRSVSLGVGRMILTRAAIRDAVCAGDIVIDPFDDGGINPNSYNYRLGDTLVHVGHGPAFTVDRKGYVLQPGNLYLGHTEEILGSRKYAMTLLGRSSTGRLGLFLNITADLGHMGSLGQWTLELRVVQPLRIYPGCRIGQIAFWETCGRPTNYDGRYWLDFGPIENRDRSLDSTCFARDLTRGER